MSQTAHHTLRLLWTGLIGFLSFSCIEPPLHLPAQSVVVDLPIVLTELEVVWDVEVDWESDWYYGWDSEDEERWGKIEYPVPERFYGRRYFLGQTPGAPHSNVDAFPIENYSFRRTYEFGWYDILIWSRIYSPDHTQVVVIDETDLDEVRATTTVTRAMSLASLGGKTQPVGLYNQPEIFYSDYIQDLYISHNKEDYDYIDEQTGAYVKKIKSELLPLVYMYMVQVILYNNEDGRVKGISGDCALSAMANGTSVNTGHTNNSPCSVYFNTNLKKGIDVKGRRADVIGGMLTTFGLCDMEGYTSTKGPLYQGSRTDLPNYLIFDIQMSGGSVKGLKCDVTEQCQRQCHGGIITVEIDCSTLDNPSTEGPGSGIFQPVVEDYEELIYDIPM